MSRQVLVLNAGYEPLSLVSVRRAIVLLLREKAELIEATQQMLHSSGAALPIPLVIRLVHYVKLPHRRVPPTRAAVKGDRVDLNLDLVVRVLALTRRRPPMGEALRSQHTCFCC